MPFKSLAQEGYFHTHRAQLERQGVNVREWDEASKGMHFKKKDPPMAKKWMQKEGSREKHAGTKGVFKAAAERAGKSTREYAEEHRHSKGKIGARARLALAFMGAKH